MIPSHKLNLFKNKYSSITWPCYAASVLMLFYCYFVFFWGTLIGVKWLKWTGFFSFLINLQTAFHITQTIKKITKSLRNEWKNLLIRFVHQLSGEDREIIIQPSTSSHATMKTNGLTINKYKVFFSLVLKIWISFILSSFRYWKLSFWRLLFVQT